MSNAWLLARRYLAHHKFRTLVLVLSIGLALYLPIASRLVVHRFAAQISSRAERTPMVVGARGSRFDVVLHALYFEPLLTDHLTISDARQVTATGYAQGIPLLVSHRARSAPIVGTTLDYFRLRSLRIAEGGQLLRLGDCVLGARFARQQNLQPGDHLLSEPENLFDLAGAYPLKMRVRGILAPSDSADDHAVFCDIKTAWIIHGIGHGHQDLDSPAQQASAGEQPSSSMLLKQDGKQLVASAAVPPYLEVTDENLASFHFHGDPATFPVSAILVVPSGPRELNLLLGRFVGEDAAQALIPSEIVGQLMEMVFRVQRLFDLAAWVVGGVTLLMLTLVILLTLGLRKGEMDTMYKLGCSRFMMVRLQAVELAIMLALSGALAVILALATSAFAWPLVQKLVLQ